MTINTLRYRSAAENVNRPTIDAFDAEQVKILETKYQHQTNVTRHTAQYLNNFRLSLYIIELGDQIDLNEYEKWILQNTLAVQVLINTILGRQELVEDGIYGPATMRCVRDIFWINIPVPARWVSTPEVSTSVLPDVAWSSAISWALILSLRRAMENDPRFKDQLWKMGVKIQKKKDSETGQKTDEDELVFPDDFENTPEYAQAMKYLDALHLTHSPEFTTENITDAQRRKKLELYLYFAEEGGNFVMDRKYITYKLIHSIYQDLIRDPSGPYQIVREGKTWSYTIVKSPIIRDDAYNLVDSVVRLPANHPYQKIIENGRAHASYLDFARTYNLVEQNHQAFVGREFLGQATLVRTILARYHITGISNEHTQDPNLLLADWDIVLPQIDARLAANPNDVRIQEELLYVKDLIQGGGWMDEPGTVNTFREINIYGKWFLEAKKLINDQYPGLERASGEEGFWKMLSSLGFEMLPIALLGSLLLWITWNGKIAGGVIIWLLWAIAWGKLIDWVQKRVVPKLTNDNLEIIRVMELRYSIKWENAPNGVLSKMYAENDRRSEQARTTRDRPEFLQNPLVLWKVVHEIYTRDDLKSLKIDDPSTVQKIKSSLTWATITGEEFNSNIWGRTSTLSEQDVLTAYEILLSQKNDDNDIYLGDVLIENGIDKVYHDYNTNWFSFTESWSFDTAIHAELRTAWTSADTVKRKELLRVMQEISNHIITGRVDASADALWYGASLMEKLKTLFTTTTPTGALIIGPDLDTKKQRIWDLKTLIDWSTLDDRLKTSLKWIIDKYVVLLEKEAEFQKVRSTWYNNESNELSYYQLTNWLRGKDKTQANLEEVQRTLSTKKTQLEALKEALWDPLYADLLAEVHKEIAYVERMEREVQLAILNNVTIQDVLPPNTQSLNDDGQREKVEKALTDIHTALRDSIAVGNTDIFGALNYNIRETITSYYQTVYNGSINWVDKTRTLGVELWDYMKQALISSLSGFPYAGSVIWGITVSTLPSATQVIGNRHLLERTAADIEAEIKLKIVQKYLTDYKETLENLRTLKDTYQSVNRQRLPDGNTHIISPNIERLLGLDYDALMSDIQSKIGEYISSYPGKEMKEMITQLSTVPNTTNLQNFETVARFLDNAQDYDDVIRDIQAQAGSAFWDASFLDDSLPLVSVMRTAFEAQKDALRSHVESTGVLEYTAGMTVAQINENIEKLEKAKDVLWIPTVILDRKIGELRDGFMDIATLGDLPDLYDAITRDKANIETLKSKLEVDWHIGWYNQGDPLPSSKEYAVTLALLQAFDNQVTYKYANFKEIIQNRQFRYIDNTVDPSVYRSVKIWDEIWSGIFQDKTLEIVDIINNN